MEFITGQRWISHSETQLGLGIVTEIASRRVKILYPAVDESRIYAIDSAPLSRIRYDIGDRVIDENEHSIQITKISDDNGLITYCGKTIEGEYKEIHELDLNCFVQFTTPQQRLFSGQLDKNKNFVLRIETLQHLHRLQQSPVKGLLGSRTDLLTHQISIASNVANRHAPRVLLADEVGLGKTIEAGMILHHQLHTGKATRALILVPDSLIHQWLVEMLRRFNISFSIFDQERIEALLEEEHGNPFDSEQKILCPLSLVCNESQTQQHLLSTTWDIVIVDEAHHLSWNEQQASPEYQCVEKLARQCESLLLLTATPEQAGLDSHFARLRLLDPARFQDFDTFQKEQAGHTELNILIQHIIENQQLNSEQQKKLEKYLGESCSNVASENIAMLLDRHGTGRILFRNSRAAVQGFPSRVANPYPLELTDDTNIIKSLIYPETNFDDESWLEKDPRVSWLVEKLKTLRPNKVLVICHYAKTAIQLDNYLNLKMGIRSTSFYEDLSIVERDRAAAYFAEGSNPDELDSGDGAQVLICSEIGSEGRNFQFSHHLILFDLPLNPDLLEQRIGRLDRIGQKQDIQIHIPYLLNTAQEILFRWINEGIQLFTQSCSASYEIYQNFSSRLNILLKSADNFDSNFLNTLIDDTILFTFETMQNLNEGRDRLLELNSCNKPAAQKLIEQIKNEDQYELLSDYMEKVFDQFGVDTEFHSENSYILRPSDHMHGNFPGLNEEGNTITFSREKALLREDMEFLSWEHPMITESMEMIHNSEFGNTALAVIKLESLPKGTLFVETWYAVNIIANKSLQLERYLPMHPTRFLVNNSKKDYSLMLPFEKLNPLCNSLPKKTALAIAEKTRAITQEIISTSQLLADKKIVPIKAKAKQTMINDLSTELDRLQSLQKINANIRNEEIEYLKDKIKLSEDNIDRAQFQLQGIRLIINN
ncbi:MAG: RNA polymerase-associated protein RapA [Gammaproteobacteria bacterium]|nr:RNA polymerase-associated protein RapA [Gammaproteobacteria bacterium]